MTVVEGLAYVLVGSRLRRREVSAGARLALTLFSLWWYSIGINKIIAGVVGVGVAFDQVSLALYVAVLHLNLAILCVSLASLLFYFAFLFTGRRHAIVPVAAFYLGFYILLTYNLLSHAPDAILKLKWRIDHHASSEAHPVVGLLILACLVLPQLVGAITHFVLYFRTTDPAQRHRIVWVSWSIIAWTVSITLITTRIFDESALVQLFSRLVGVAAAFAGLWAYRVAPPKMSG